MAVDTLKCDKTNGEFILRVKARYFIYRKCSNEKCGKAILMPVIFSFISHSSSVTSPSCGALYHFSKATIISRVFFVSSR